MGDPKQYWKEVRSLEQSLPQFVWLMSLEDPKRGMVGGRMAEMGAAQAAERLHGRSHRMATDGEISAHLAQQDLLRRQSLHDGLRRRGIAVVSLPANAESNGPGGKRAATKRQ